MRKDKAAKKERRLAEKELNPGGPPIEAIDPADLGLPELSEAEPEEEEETEAAVS